MKVKRRIQISTDASVGTDGNRIIPNVAQSSRFTQSVATRSKDNPLQRSVETRCVAAATDNTLMRNSCVQTSRPQTAVLQKKMLEKKLKALEREREERERQAEQLKQQLEDYQRRQNGMDEEMESVNQKYAITSARIALLQWQLAVVSDTLIAEEKDCMQTMCQMRDKFSSIKEKRTEQYQKEDDLVSVHNMEMQTDPAFDDVDTTVADDQGDESEREDLQGLAGERQPLCCGRGQSAISRAESGFQSKNVTIQSGNRPKTSTCILL